MTNEFWVGLGLSIPIGIGVNLVTDPMQAWAGRRSRRLEMARERKLSQAQATAEFFAGNSSAYQAFMFEALLRLIATVAILVFISIAAFAIPFYAIGNVLGINGEAIAAVSATIGLLWSNWLIMSLLNSRRRTVDMAARVSDLTFEMSRSGMPGEGSMVRAQTPSSREMAINSSPSLDAAEVVEPSPGSAGE